MPIVAVVKYINFSTKKVSYKLAAQLVQLIKLFERNKLGEKHYYGVP